jgi:hypothetical protein
MRRARPVDVASILGECGKKRYSNKRAAEDAAERQMAYAQERFEALDLRVYECPNSWCKGWHLTERRER